MSKTRLQPLRRSLGQSSKRSSTILLAARQDSHHDTSKVGKTITIIIATLGVSERKSRQSQQPRQLSQHSKSWRENPKVIGTLGELGTKPQKSSRNSESWRESHDSHCNTWSLREKIASVVIATSFATGCNLCCDNHPDSRPDSVCVGHQVIAVFIDTWRESHFIAIFIPSIDVVHCDSPNHRDSHRTTITTFITFTLMEKLIATPIERVRRQSSSKLSRQSSSCSPRRSANNHLKSRDTH
jgi:hypothetical protein